MSTLLQQVAQPPDQNITCIYGLVDPITQFVRYVGKANDPFRRLQVHLTPGRLKCRGHKNTWIKSLLAIGERPEVILLEKVPIRIWQNAERKWIAYYRRIPGYPDLTNGTVGGDGMSPGARFKGDNKYKKKRHTVEQPLDPSYRIIPLTRGKNTLVSAARYEELMQWNWCASGCESTGYYAVRFGKDGEPSVVSMHSYIMGNPDIEAYHINRNTLDNRDENLCFATHSQKMAKHGKFRNNTSGYKGVKWHKGGKNWRAGIRMNGVDIWLGGFDDITEAARAYDKAALCAWGEFAQTNFSRSEYSENDISNGLKRNPLTRKNTSGYRGVTRNGSIGWMTSISHNGKSCYIGTWRSREEAARQYDLKSIELLGERAILNFPRSNHT